MAVTNPSRKFSIPSAFPVLHQVRLPIMKFLFPKIWATLGPRRDGTWLFSKKLPKFQYFQFSKLLKIKDQKH